MYLIFKFLESSSPKDAFRQVLWKLTQRFWRRRFLHIVNVFSLFRYHLTLEKGDGLTFELESRIGPVVLEKIFS